MAQEVLAVIPARGGSKGVPRKNIRLLADQPLISHTINAALQSRNVHRVIVSTDDLEIAEVARSFGAEVPFLRPEEFATDTATSLSAIQHAMAWLQDHEAYQPEAVAVLAPTSPLRTISQIEATVDLLWSSERDSALTICAVQDHPYFIYQQDVDGSLSELVAMTDKPLRRQDLPSFYTHSQAVVASRYSYLKHCDELQAIFNFQSMAGYLIDRDSALDIDTVNDFLRAEALLKQRQEQSLLVA